MNTETQTAGKPNNRRSKRRRWPFAVVVIILILGLLVLLIPTFVSTPRITNVLLGLANGRIKGSVRVQDLSTSWRGPTTAREVMLCDPQGRKVLHASSVHWSRGLWAAATSLMAFGEVKVDSPHVVLYAKSDGGVSITDAVKSRYPTTQPARRLPRPIGKLIVEGADVQIVQTDGDSYRIPAVKTSIDLDTLANVRGKIHMTTPEGAAVAGDFDLHRLVEQDNFTPRLAEGTVRLKTTGTAAIAPLAAILFDQKNVGGGASVNLVADFKPGQTRVDFDSRLLAFRAGRTGQETLRPIDVNLHGQLRRDGNKITADTVTTGQPGRIESRLVYVESDQSADLSYENLSELIVNGQGRPLPDFSLEANGQVDIPTLSRAIPALLTLRRGVDITHGTFSLRGVRVRGGAQPAAVGSVEFTEVSAVREARQLNFSPITAAFNTTVESNRGLLIQRGVFTSGFAQVDAQGPLRDLAGRFRGDLAKLSRFGEVFELFSTDMTGQIEGQIRVTRNQRDRLNVESRMAVSQFQYQTGQNRLSVRQANVNWNGFFQLAPRRAAGGVIDGQLDTLTTGQGPKAFREDRLRFSTDAHIDPAAQSMLFDRLAVNTPALAVQGSGAIHDYTADRVLELSGRYQGSWERLNELLYQYSPPARQTVVFTGQSAGPFSIRIPLTDPVLPRMVLRGGASWSGGRVYGLDLAPSSVTLAMQNGVMQLPREPVPASDGFIHLGGTVDFRPTPAVLNVPETVSVLDNIHINKQIGQQLLSRVNPILGHVDELDGRATLRVSDLNFPLSKEGELSAVGHGQLDLSQIRLAPSGLLGELLKISTLGTQKLYSVQMNTVDLTLAQGRLRYENFKMIFLLGAYDMVFFGSIGLFDEVAHLFVSLPLKPALLDRFDLRPAPLRPEDLLLKGIRIVIPLMGTRTDLRADLSHDTLRQIIRESLKGIILQPGREIDQFLRPFERREGGQDNTSILDSLLPWRRGAETEPGPVERREQRFLDLFRPKNSN